MSSIQKHAITTTTPVQSIDPFYSPEFGAYVTYVTLLGDVEVVSQLYWFAQVVARRQSDDGPLFCRVVSLLFHTRALFSSILQYMLSIYRKINSIVVGNNYLF